MSEDFVWHSKCTGDLSSLKDIVNPVSISGNWFIGNMISNPELTLSIKVFNEPSDYGIGFGRISKMCIHNASKGENISFYDSCEMNYDRGWDIKPKTKDAYENCKLIVEALGSELPFKYRAKRNSKEQIINPGYF